MIYPAVSLMIEASLQVYHAKLLLITTHMFPLVFSDKNHNLGK